MVKTKRSRNYLAAHVGYAATCAAMLGVIIHIAEGGATLGDWIKALFVLASVYCCLAWAAAERREYQRALIEEGRNYGITTESGGVVGAEGGGSQGGGEAPSDRKEEAPVRS